MNNFQVAILTCVPVSVLLMSTTTAQTFESTPVSLDDFWNADGWARDADPLQSWGLDASGKRLLVSSLPVNVLPGQVNLSADGEVAFLLPEMDDQQMDVYYPAGDLIPVPPGNYKYLYLALLSGSGTWGQPYEENNWGPILDPATDNVLDPRSEMNSFKPIYTDGEGDWIPIEPVNDWFWPTTEKVVPASGNRDDVVLEFLAYDANTKGSSYLLDQRGKSGHNGGQYSTVAREGNFFTYFMDGLSGLTDATLWLEIWGNSKISISTDDENYTELFNSVTADQAYPDEGRRYYPNRQLKDFSLAPYLESGDVEQIYLKFEDAAPILGYGPRLRYAGIFTGDAEKTSSGSQVWPGLIRDDGSFPNPDPGGIVLIKRRYDLDESRSLGAIQMPDNMPRNAPILSVFAMTLANERTAACDFNGDGACDTTDIDQLMSEVAAGTHLATFDLNGDGTVDDIDRNAWLFQAASENGFAEPLLVGDSNLDGTVNATDLNALALSWRQDVQLWTRGNFTGAGVDSADLNALALNWRRTIAPAPQAVPEPAGLSLILVGLTILLFHRGSGGDGIRI